MQSLLAPHVARKPPYCTPSDLVQDLQATQVPNPASGNKQIKGVVSAVSYVDNLDDHLLAVKSSLESKLEAVAALGSRIIESSPSVGYLAVDFNRGVVPALK